MFYTPPPPPLFLLSVKYKRLHLYTLYTPSVDKVSGEGWFLFQYYVTLYLKKLINKIVHNCGDIIQFKIPAYISHQQLDCLMW